MANGNQQRCCVLGVCCDPGGTAQRAALRAWLVEQLDPAGSERVIQAGEVRGLVDGWLDELFAPEYTPTAQDLGDDG